MNDTTQNSVRNMLTTEVKWVISIVVFVVGAVGPYYSMKQDIALIQQNISNINANHEVHIQDILQNIKDIKDEQTNQQAQIIELQKQIISKLK